MKVLIESVKSAAGYSLYINNFRVAGPKPTLPGPTERCWEADVEDIQKAMKQESEEEE